MASDLELTEVAANVLRQVYLSDNSNTLRRGLLIEPARTNKIAFARNFNDPSWTQGFLSSVAQVSGGPGITTNRLTETSDGATNRGHEVRQTSVPSLTSGVNICMSALAKAGPRTFLALFTTSGGVNAISYFDLSTGTWGNIGAAHVAQFKREMDDNNWWFGVRLLSTNLEFVRFRMASANGTNLYIGDGTSYLDLAWAQLEEGSYPTLPIESAAAGGLLKPADVDYVDVAALASPQIPLDPDVVRTEYTTYVELGTMGIEGGTIDYFGNNLNTGVRQYIEFIGGLPRFVFDNGVTSVNSPMASAPAWNDYVEFRVECRRSGSNGTFLLNMSLNDGAEVAGVESSSIALPAEWGGTRYYRGSKAGSGVGHLAWVNRVQGPGLQSRAAMRNLSGPRTFEGWG